jgi:hypothetical protein
MYGKAQPVLTTSPTSRSSNASRLRLVAALLTAPLAGACGTEPGDGEEPAGVALTRQALGSPDLNPTDIWTLSDLDKIRNKLTGHYRLRANIDASATANWNGGKGWVPISRFTGTFKGSYINGNNVETTYQITNLKINRPNEYNVGFFSTLKEAIVDKISLTNVSIRGGGVVGAVAGLVLDSQITSSYVEGGTVTAQITGAQGYDIGMFAGVVAGGTTSRSYVVGTVDGYATNLGGFAGRVTASAVPALLTECYANVAVSPSQTANATIAGGMVGLVEGDDTQVKSVWAMGTVNGRGGVGGLVGRLGAGTWFHFGIARNLVVDWDWPAAQGGWAGTYGSTTVPAEVERLGPLFWDTNVDASTHFQGVGQSGHSTTVLRQATINNPGIFLNGGDEQWDAFDPGTSQQHHVLKNVVRASLQPR